MPERRLQFNPGIDVESTQTASRGGWNASNLIRFRSGYVEKLRGWAHLTTTPMNGVCRTIHYWADLLSQQWIAAGTNTNLYVENQGTLYDITPGGFVPGKRSSPDPPPPTTLFSLLIWSLDNFGQIGLFCPSGGPIYSWTPPVLPAVPAQALPVSAGPAILVGGLVSPSLTLWHAIVSGGLSMTVNGLPVNLTGLNFSAVTGPADIAAIIQAAIGAGVVTVTGVVVGGRWQFTITTVLQNSAASLSYATAPVSGGTNISGIIGWTAATATSLIPQGGGAPAFNQGILVTMPQRIVMAFGSSPDGGALDPLLVRWSDQDNYTSWEPTVTNQAGSFRLPRGDRIVGAIQSGLATFLWTEYELWTAQYEGFPFVFGFFQQGASCGLIAENARANLGTTTYWMGDHGFFLTTGTGFQQIPCSVWDFVYLDLDANNRDKCLAATDYHFREVFFFFPSQSGGTGEIDSYVKFNVMENLWDTGNLIRTAWSDLNPGTPIGIDVRGIFQQHDVGLDNDGTPMTGVMVESGFIDIADGSNLVLVKRLIPDNLWEGAAPSYEIRLLVRSFPGDTIVVTGPYVITPQTDYVSIGVLSPIPTLGVRGREVALRINCDQIDSWFRLGIPRAEVQEDGAL